MQRLSITPKEAELSPFINFLESLSSAPNHHRDDYLAAISEVVQKGVIPISLLDLCAALRKQGAALPESEPTHASTRVPLPDVFLRVVSALSGASLALQVGEGSDRARDRRNCQQNENLTVNETGTSNSEKTATVTERYTETAYRGFVDGV